MSFLQVRSVLCAALIAAPMAAQSTTVLENPLIRVIDALDVPHRKTALHKHDFNRVMIYITSGDLDVTGEDGRTDHQHWKAGDVAWSPAGPLHVSENVGTTELRIVEIEIKTPGNGTAKRNPSFDPIVIDPKHNQVVFENPQVRVIRSSLDLDGRERWHEHVGSGRAAVLLTPLAARLEFQKKQSNPMNGGPGDVFWSDGVVRHRASNLGSRAAQIVVVEVK
jgi:quercetin dioxygenase-like cupin family protein